MGLTNIENQSELPELNPYEDSSTESESEESYKIKFDKDIRSAGEERLLTVYDQINAEEDLGTMLAELLTGVHWFGHALTLSNTVNGRQGKSRISFSSEQKELMQMSDIDNYDVFEDRELNKLFIYVLNQYLEDKQVIPENKPRVAISIEGKVKTLFVMLIATGQYGLIPELNIPPFIKPLLDEVFNFIEDQQSEVLDLWIQYLEDHESKEIAEIVINLGNEFWGSENMNSKSIFDMRFRKVTHKFKDFEGTYQAYLKFRDDQIKFSRSIARNRLIPFFDNNPNNEFNVDRYNNYRKGIINEFLQIFTEDQNALAIQKLIYG